MISVKEAKKIGLNACIEKIGRDFVTAHRDSGSSAFGECEVGVYCFVGVSDREIVFDNDEIVLDSGTKFPYRASCTVSLADGTPKFIEWVIPN